MPYYGACCAVKGEDLIVNIRLTHKMNERLSLYLEGHDLADKDAIEQTWNESMTYSKFVLNMKKHRSVLLGINYRL